MHKILIGLSLAATLCAANSELEMARDKQDRPALEKLANAYAAAARTSKDPEAQYKAALAYSYLAEVAIEVRDKNQAKSAAESGIPIADRAIELSPNNAEYHRVLATLCGQVIPAEGIAGLSYGKRAKIAIDRAVQLNPKSAEVRIAEGVGNYYIPPMFGGGPELAVKDFNYAIALEPKSAEAYMWLGVALRKLHKNAEARQAFAKSVELNPRRIWAKEQLDKTPAQ